MRGIFTVLIVLLVLRYAHMLGRGGEGADAGRGGDGHGVELALMEPGRKAGM